MSIAPTTLLFGGTPVLTINTVPDANGAICSMDCRSLTVRNSKPDAVSAGWKKMYAPMAARH
ncbi:MAG: hypothetical protein V7K47_12455 [Nostoc sp.]